MQQDGMLTDAQPVKTCPICDGTPNLWRIKRTAAGDFRIDRCTHCGFAFVNPRPTPHFLHEFYSSSGHNRDGSFVLQTLGTVLAQEYSQPNSTLDAVRMIQTTIELLPGGHLPGARLLDIGCGYGFFSREARAQGFDITALEVAENERGIAQKLACVNPLNILFEDYNESPGAFSAVVMSQTLEHALDIKQWLMKTHSLLAPDGVIAIAVPNFGSLFRLVMQENEPFIIPPAHLNYFTSKNLSSLLVQTGFTVRKVEWVTRISAASIRKRIPAPLAGLVVSTADSAFRRLDTLRLGMMLNVYATRNRTH